MNRSKVAKVPQVSTPSADNGLVTLTSSDVCRMLADALEAVLAEEPGAIKRCDDLAKWAGKYNREMNAQLRAVEKIVGVVGKKPKTPRAPSLRMPRLR